MLTHINEKGEAIMVDISEKAVTARTATAYARIRMQPAALAALLNADLKKGDGLAAARIAGILGAKKTSELIPLCHNIPLDKVTVTFEKEGDGALGIYVRAKCTYKTGDPFESGTPKYESDIYYAVHNVELNRFAYVELRDFTYEGGNGLFKMSVSFADVKEYLG